MISVIVPFYNYKNIERFTVWKYLKRQKNLEELEIIVINDGSDKEHSKILKEETADIPNLYILKNSQHKGFSVSLNEGIRKSKGEYITFWFMSNIFAENTLQKLKEAIEGYDLAVCSINFLCAKDPIPEIIDNISYLDEDNRENTIFTLINRNLFIPLGNKLYRKDLILKHNLFFDELATQWNADELFNIKYFSAIKSANVVKEPLQTITVLPVDDYSSFNENRLLMDHKIWLAYSELISKLKFGSKIQNLIEELYLNKIYLAVANFERCYWPIEDKLQFLQTFFNDDTINEILIKKEESFYFSYYFVEYLLLAMLDDIGNSNIFVRNFDSAMATLISSNHTQFISKENLLAILYKTRKMNERDNFLLPILQSDIYLSLLRSSSSEGAFNADYFEKCRERCNKAINHPDNKYQHGKHIYDVVSLNLNDE